jgi:hypothetical protein
MDSAFDICLRSMNDGHFGIGSSATVEYHFDRTSIAVIGTLTWTWDRDRFELAAFGFLNAQVQDRVALGNPNWTYEISRRWTFIRNPCKMFFGLDAYSGSRGLFCENRAFSNQCTSRPIRPIG